LWKFFHPRTVGNEVLGKVSEYLDAGVTEVWVVDPEDRSVDAFRINQRRRFLGEHAEITSPDLLPDFKCHVADFFRHV
jgi:Uma2 family endonuclease